MYHSTIHKSASRSGYIRSLFLCYVLRYAPRPSSIAGQARPPAFPAVTSTEYKRSTSSPRSFYDPSRSCTRRPTMFPHIFWKKNCHLEGHRVPDNGVAGRHGPLWGAGRRLFMMEARAVTRIFKTGWINRKISNTCTVSKELIIWNLTWTY
jgi:hypothetical protein